MTDPARKKELALILCFLGIIFVVPVAQICLELWRGERVQFTDVFRYQPTAKNLRQFEKTLEDKSWFQQTLRPKMQRLLFETLQDTGSKAILGREGWLFYRPDVRYLAEPDRLEDETSASAWVQPPDGSTHRDHVVRAIVRFRDQLKERGIELLVVPVPGKPSIYPDRLTRRAEGIELASISPTSELLSELGNKGVATLDLSASFRERRRHSPMPPTGSDLYLARDTHWTPQGAKLAAGAVARRLKELGWTPPATNQFLTKRIQVNRHGDILEMTQIPGIQRHFAPQSVECEQVIDPAFGLLVPSKSDRQGAYKYPAQNSSILVLGDSFCRIYQMPEPPSLGEIAGPTTGEQQQEPLATKKLLPGSAGFISHLALALQAPVDAIVSDGGASSDVRKKLSTDPEILEGKKIVVWEFVERDIGLGKEGWEEVPLPPKLGP
ncbi:MAG: hypothetical protein AAB466_03890 [Verrucomicrobiota bacterium]